MCPTAGQQVQWSITSSKSPKEKIVFESDVANKNAEPSLRVENASIRLKLNDNKKKTKVSLQSNTCLGTIKSRCWVKQNSHFLWCPCSLKSWEYRQHPSLAATALNSIKLNPSQLSVNRILQKNSTLNLKATGRALSLLSLASTWSLPWLASTHSWKDGWKRRGWEWSWQTSRKRVRSSMTSRLQAACSIRNALNEM